MGQIKANTNKTITQYSSENSRLVGCQRVHNPTYTVGVFAANYSLRLLGEAKEVLLLRSSKLFNCNSIRYCYVVPCWDLIKSYLKLFKQPLKIKSPETNLTNKRDSRENKHSNNQL
jgi:hypothetical protein